jgi:hypothetical protein
VQGFRDGSSGANRSKIEDRETRRSRCGHIFILAPNRSLRLKSQ